MPASTEKVDILAKMDSQSRICKRKQLSRHPGLTKRLMGDTSAARRRKQSRPRISWSKCWRKRHLDGDSRAVAERKKFKMGTVTLALLSCFLSKAPIRDVQHRSEAFSVGLDAAQRERTGVWRHRGPCWVVCISRELSMDSYATPIKVFRVRWTKNQNRKGIRSCYNLGSY